MVDYRFDPHPGGAQQVLLSLIRPGMEVLDVGCASGYLGSRLTEMGCRVWGIERDPIASSRIPSEAYIDVFVANLESVRELPWPNQAFDVILAADILEHLLDPAAILIMLKRYLRRGGYVLVSVPNIAHFSVRLQLLIGRFRYESAGILDRTHLHFYTFETARRLVSDAGFRVERELVGSDRFGNLLNRHPKLMRSLMGALAYNIVLVARSAPSELGAAERSAVKARQ